MAYLDHVGDTSSSLKDWQNKHILLKKQKWSLDCFWQSEAYVDDFIYKTVIYALLQYLK